MSKAPDSDPEDEEEEEDDESYNKMITMQESEITDRERLFSENEIRDIKWQKSGQY